jgi:endonuclease/exonuclease/phosphatase family metal-dependent hydrolase
MRLATYNHLHGGSASRNAHWTSLMREVEPDIVFCQEASRLPRPELQTFGGKLFWNAVPGMKWGTGIWTREHKYTRVPVNPEFAGWPTAAKTGKRGLMLFSVHCPAGEKGYVDTMNRIVDAVHTMSEGRPVIVAGDFNVVAGYRRDDDVVKMSRGEQRLLDRIRDELGLIACWQSANPDVPLGQTLRWMRNKVTPYHCDGIFVPAAWRDRLVSCRILSGPAWDALSDHNPVVAEVADVA